MSTNKDYVRYIRGKVGHDMIFLNFAGGIVDLTNALSHLGTLMPECACCVSVWEM